MMSRHFGALLVIAQVLLLPLLHTTAMPSANIDHKSGKSSNIVQAQQKIQEQQQQQQSLKASTNTQNAHLNSLTAFASNYDNVDTTQVQVQTANEAGFKPSYKLPEMETNFTPMQSGSLTESPSIASLPSTPMLMQYLPTQTLQDGSGAVHYLQLIPTRPIIVPISPYLAGGSTGSAETPAARLMPNVAAMSDYGARAVQQSTLPANTALHYSAAGLQGGYAFSPAAAYRSTYRINREAKEKSFPPAISLNLNEYLPATVSGHDAGSTSNLHSELYNRSRT